MIPQDEWTRWSEDWRAAPGPGAQELAAQTHRFGQRMRWGFGVELAFTLLVSAQALQQLLNPASSPGFRMWCVGMLALLWALQAMTAFNRRGLWKSEGLPVMALLRLSQARARSAIRYVYINVAGVALILAVSVPLLVYEWQHDASRQANIRLIAICETLLIVVMLAWSAWQLRRQKRRLRELEVLTHELAED